MVRSDRTTQNWETGRTREAWRAWPVIDNPGKRATFCFFSLRRTIKFARSMILSKQKTVDIVIFLLLFRPARGVVLLKSRSIYAPPPARPMFDSGVSGREVARAPTRIPRFELTMRISRALRYLVLMMDVGRPGGRRTYYLVRLLPPYIIIHSAAFFRRRPCVYWPYRQSLFTTTSVGPPSI